MKKMFLLSRWFLAICAGVWLGIWLEADLDPVNCPKELALCGLTDDEGNVLCRKYPDNPFIEECTYLKCKYGGIIVSRTPVWISCCTSNIKPPRSPSACCNIPYLRVQCKTSGEQFCSEEILPQECSEYFSVAWCPEELPPPPGQNRTCIRRPTP
jgi:hypothetical protein